MDEIRCLMDGARIAHWTPGRIRIVFGDHIAAECFAKSVVGLQGVTSAKANPLTGSVLIHYCDEIGDVTALLSQLGGDRTIHESPRFRNSSIDRQILHGVEAGNSSIDCCSSLGPSSRRSDRYRNMVADCVLRFIRKAGASIFEGSSSGCVNRRRKRLGNPDPSEAVNARATNGAEIEHAKMRSHAAVTEWRVTATLELEARTPTPASNPEQYLPRRQPTW